ncbi:CAAX prenyl protease 1 [Dissophora globulifera]|uniref:CAAX prenyl protease n=1 Tax=Dissophora globulifera TaxID=979702 RepID=A0A9P6URH7_9FUNG|nr:CAAX prenyl protease 1 [Dissophora globulifera]
MGASLYDTLHRSAYSLLGQPDTGAFPYKASVLGFMYIVFLWEEYLRYRHYRNLRSKIPPKALKEYVSEEQFQKAQAYGLDKTGFGFVESIFNQIQSTLTIVFDFLPWLWGLSGDVMFKMTGYGSEYEITQSIIFFVLMTVFSTIVSLPFSLYSTFVIEERHGFNKQTLRLYFTDMIKGHLVGGAIGMPFLAGFLKIIKIGGESFYYYVWLFMVAFQLIMVSIYPTFIQPLFNKFEPLKEGELRNMIEALASRIHFPLTKLFVIDGSKRSGHSNAYFYGFFKNKRIVLFDTLLEHSNNDEICAVLAHELGHWACNHTVKMLIFGQVQIFAIFYLFSQFINNKDMYTSFGFMDATPTLIGFLLFNFLYSPVESVIGFITNMISRRYEFQADAFARDLGYAGSLASGLIKLQLKNLGTMNPDWLHSMYHRSHPELVERLNAINQPGVGAKTDKVE